MKHKRLKLLLFFIGSFGFGFIVHALFFPYLFSEKQLDQSVRDVTYVKNAALQATPADQVNDLITYVDYAAGNFHPSTVTITRGNYVAITNRHKDRQMWLSSTTKFLNTARPYATGERLQTTIKDPGTYSVVDKLNPDVKLTVVVR